MLLLRPTGGGAWQLGPSGQAMAGVYGGADPPERTAKELNGDTVHRSASLRPWAKAQ